MKPRAPSPPAHSALYWPCPEPPQHTHPQVCSRSAVHSGLLPQSAVLACHSRIHHTGSHWTKGSVRPSRKPQSPLSTLYGSQGCPGPSLLFWAPGSCIFGAHPQNSRARQATSPACLEHEPCPAALSAQPEPGTAQGLCTMKRLSSNCSSDRPPSTTQYWDNWPVQLSFSFTIFHSSRLSLETSPLLVTNLARGGWPHALT